MTTNYGFCFWPELGRDDCSGRLRMWVAHRGQTRFLPTDYDIRAEEWDAVSGTLITNPRGHENSHGNNGSNGNGNGTHDTHITRNPIRRLRLSRYSASMTRDLRRVQTVIRNLEQSRRRFTADDITEEIHKTIFHITSY